MTTLRELDGDAFIATDDDLRQCSGGHPEEAKAIIRNAQAFVDQFRDKEREELISLLVLEKYFRHTRQN